MRDEFEIVAEDFAHFDELARVAAGQDDLHGDGQRLALFHVEFGDAFLREREQRVEFFATERMAFGRALQFDEAAAVVHDDVHVGVARAVFGVVEIEHRNAAIDADGNRRDRAVHRIALDRVLRLQPVDRIDQRDIRAGDRRGARAAIGLEHVAVERDGAFAERGAIDAGAQAASDQALDFHRAPALSAARGFALRAFARRARQHAVFGGDPAFALAAQERRHFFLDARRAQHARFAE